MLRFCVCSYVNGTVVREKGLLDAQCHMGTFRGASASVVHLKIRLHDPLTSQSRHVCDNLAKKNNNTYFLVLNSPSCWKTSEKDELIQSNSTQ